MNPADVEDPIEGMERGLALHNCCVAGEVDAFLSVVNTYLPGLVRKVEQKYPRHFDPSQYEAAALMALCSYSLNFNKYKPEKGISLFSYLVMAARRDFLNLRQRDNRQTRGQNDLFVEDDDNASEIEIEDPKYVAFEEILIRDDSIVWGDIARLLPDERDQFCAYMILNQERATEVYAEIYGLTSLPPKEQEHEVKKHKDRVKKRLYRNLDPERYRRHD